jgi:DNA-binding NarL/FixJ family response regulator
MTTGARSPRGRTVLLVEPHAVCRLALGRLIWSVGPELILAGEASDLASGVRLAADLVPDIILFEIADITGCRHIATLLHAAPSARIAVLSSKENGEAAFAALHAGAFAFVPKSAAPEDILGSLRLVAGGERVVHPSVTISTLVFAAEQEATWREARSKWSRLTHRERDVLQLLASGFRSRQIADHLFLSRRTVEWYLSSAYRKLEVHGRIEALREVHRMPLASVGS